MIPESANLPDNARWSDFDDDSAAEENKELMELKRKWEDSILTSKEFVQAYYPTAFFSADMDWKGNIYNCIVYRSLFSGQVIGKADNEADAWHEAAKEILRGVL